jgi:nucleoside-diphosphate-sugar epimerase
MDGTTLIVGCGYIGAALAKMLVAAGGDVIGMRRHPAALPPGVRPFAADLTRDFDLKPLGPIRRVVFAAAADSHSAEAYERTYVAGVLRLSAALARLPLTIERLVFISSTSVYGDTGGADVTESSPAVPESFAGRLLLEAELIARGAAPCSVALRFGGIYGPGRWRLAEQAAAGEAKLQPHGGNVTNRIHRDDGAAAVRHILALPDPAAVYNVVDDEPALYNDVVGWLAARRGVSLATGEAGESAAGRQLRGNKRCSNALLTASGFRCRYPSYREGYAAFFAGSGDD